MNPLARLSLLIRTFVVFLATAGVLCWWIDSSRSAGPGQTSAAVNDARRAINQQSSAVNLHESTIVSSEYTGDEQLQNDLRQNLARSVSLASGDFDEDGLPDLIAGYAGPTSGILVMHRGSLDAIFPDTPHAQERKKRGEDIAAPFLSPASVIAAAESPDFLAVGDFDADGHLDLATAARFSNSLYLFSGDGHGSLVLKRTIHLSGSIWALTSGEIDRHDGLTDIVISVSSSKGASVLIFSSPRGALQDEPEVISVPNAVTALALGRLVDSGFEDLAIAAGSSVFLVAGRAQQAKSSSGSNSQERISARTIRQFSFANEITAMVAGDFPAGERQRLMLMTSDGNIQAVSREAEGWMKQTVNSGRWPQVNGLVKAHVSVRAGDDLVVLNSATQELEILTNDSVLATESAESSLGASAASGAVPLEDNPVSTEAPRTEVSTPNSGRITKRAHGVAFSASTVFRALPPVRLNGEASISFDSMPAAVLPMRLTRDATNSLVVLKQGETAPEVLTGSTAADPQAAFVVTNTNPSGSGSLAQAILNSNAAAPGPNTITFTIPNSGVHTINLTAQLPTVTIPVTIDGYTQSGSSANTSATADNAVLQIELNGAGAGSSVGLLITAGTCTVRGLIVNRFGNVGIESHTTTAVGNIIEGNFVGTDATGMTALGNGTSVANAGGVFIANGATNNTIGGTAPASRNLISGNINDGIQFYSGGGSNPNPSNNTVQGNLFGTNATAAGALGNNRIGVYMSGSPNNTIGGMTSAARNIVSRNGDAGVEIGGSASTGNVVQGNYIGTDFSGTSALGNGAIIASAAGVFLWGGASINTVGGTSVALRNLISGNLYDGIQFFNGGGTNPNPFNNFIQGNLIGTNVSGTGALPNLRIGIFNSGSPGNTIGGSSSGARNIISGNSSVGIEIVSSTASGNVVAGNLVGTDVTGVNAVPNASTGIFISSAPGNTIGGTTSGARNIISANSGNLVIAGSTATSNSIQGNYIGTDINGTAALGSGAGFQGIFINGAGNNFIGGTAAGAGNVISGNQSNGIWMINSGASGNQIQGNFIGTNAAGTAAIPNASWGIVLDSGTTGNVIGGTTASARNIISGNTLDGILLQSSTATNNSIQGNFIGTDVNGTAALGNARLGIFNSGSPGNSIGGTSAGARNVISGNASVGVQIQGSTATGNTLSGNFIGTNVTGATALGNGGSGVFISGAPGNTIGGTTAAARNIISGNSGNNVAISGSSATGNFVQGNYIGTDVTGSVALGSGSGFQGVIISGAANNVVGGTVAGAGNLISGNRSNGIWIVNSGASGNQIQGNLIGTNAAGTGAIPNTARGVEIDAGATNNVVGGTAAGVRNVISGNSFDGVLIQGSTTTNNFVQGNFIGTDINGTAALANLLNGVLITGGNNTIGGTSAAARNIISGNSGAGIQMNTAAATGNFVQGNYIGTNLAGTAALGNSDVGVDIEGGSSNTIGGTTAAARNIISGNLTSGIIINGSNSNQVQGNYIGTNVNGNSALGNGDYGVWIIVGTGNTIGGTAVGSRNIISNNATSGIEMDDGNNFVQGNYIGTDATGTQAFGNIEFGVASFGNGNVIGGPTTGAGNFISANHLSGVILGADSNAVQGNIIGMSTTGSALGNAGHGIEISGAQLAAIGGTAAGAGNTVAFNSGDGVNVTDFVNPSPQGFTIPSIGDNIRGNSIFSNGGLGIDLGPNGPTPNDACDSDSGPNNLQNYPVITQAVNASGQTIITGNLNSLSATTFTLDFYSSPAADPSGFGEGRTYLGSRTLSITQGCIGTFNFSFPTVTLGQFISATATDPGNSTSEFSLAVPVTTPTAAQASLGGRITTADGLPLAGVTIELLGGGSGRTITDANGGFQFDNLEAGNLYTVTPSLANYSFNPANRTVSLLGGRTEAIFTAVADSVVRANPLDSNLFFIREQYLDFLAREPDSGGLAYWNAQLEQCGNNEACDHRRVDVAAAFFVEREFQNTGSFVYRLYVAGLGRQLSFNEFSQDRQQLVDGLDLESEKAALTGTFVQRREFLSAYATATDALSFVNALIRNVRQSSGVDISAQRPSLIIRYNSGRNLIESRSQALQEVVEDANFARAEYNPTFVLMEYFGYLRRDPDKAGYDFWLDVLNNREPNNYRGMVCAFVTSAEYQRRFSSAVTRSDAECSR